MVNLAFEGLNSVPAEYGIWLVDKALKTTTDLRQRSTYSVAAPSIENPKRLTLVVGKKSYVAERLAEFDLVPTSYELFQNFPNPFSPGDGHQLSNRPNRASARGDLRPSTVLSSLATFGSPICHILDVCEIGEHFFLWRAEHHSCCLRLHGCISRNLRVHETESIAFIYLDRFTFVV